jgi:hypothetical protein
MMLTFYMLSCSISMKKIQIIGILFLPPSKFGIVKVLIFFFNLFELILQVMINKTNNQPLLSGE